MKKIALKHQFVDFIPTPLEKGVLYVSIEFATASHLCVCGCGKEVTTPLSPTDWKLIYDGKSVTLYPSIGNWGFECRSHYWITSDQVRWAADWDDEKIKQNRQADIYAKSDYYQTSIVKESELSAPSAPPADIDGFWTKLRRMLLG